MFLELMIGNIMLNRKSAGIEWSDTSLSEKEN